MGILMIIYGLHNIYFFIYITYMSVCNVVCSDVAYGTAAAIHRTITWKWAKDGNYLEAQSQTGFHKTPG